MTTVLPPREAHALWAATYDSAPNPLVALETRVVEPLLPELTGLVVADVAAGTGRWARYALSRGGSAIAIDFCAEMLARAPRPVVLADACRLPVATAAVDLTICAFGISYSGICLDELARITRAGGFVVVSDMHPQAVGRGWKRGFAAGSGSVEIEQYPYSITDLRCRGLRLTRLVESAFEPADLADPSRYERVGGVPAVFAAVWRRDGR